MSPILIVDDDPRIREVLSRWLEAAGHETQQAADAETALSMLTAGQVAVALCDVTMPGRSGLWLVEQAREQCPSVAVVLATGMENVHPSISLAGNVVEYLIKPFEREAVLTAVSLARAWHETAARQAAASGGDPLSKWLQGGQAQDSDRK